MARCGWKSVEFESLLEKDWLVVTNAFNRDLVAIEAQPCIVEYWFDGKHRKWIPDFRMSLRTETRPVLVEVKTVKVLYPSDAGRRAFAHGKWRAIELAANAAGFGFMLATENEIRIRPRLDNAVLVAAVVNRLFPEDRIAAGLDAALELPAGANVRDLERLLGGRCDGLDVAVHLAWQGLIRLDPSSKWSWDSTFVRTRRPM